MADRPIGKKELLSFASQVAARPVTKMDDLADGSVFLKIFAKVWPKVTEFKRWIMRVRPRYDWEVKGNWETLRNVMADLKLPVAILDQAGIQEAKFKPCYNILVMLFFLYNLARNHDFSVDFAHPIDTRLAQFLQSRQSIESLVVGGALKLKDIQAHMGSSFSRIDASSNVEDDFNPLQLTEFDDEEHPWLAPAPHETSSAWGEPQSQGRRVPDHRELHSHGNINPTREADTAVEEGARAQLRAMQMRAESSHNEGEDPYSAAMWGESFSHGQSPFKDGKREHSSLDAVRPPPPPPRHQPAERAMLSEQQPSHANGFAEETGHADQAKKKLWAMSIGGDGAQNPKSGEGSRFKPADGKPPFQSGDQTLANTLQDRARTAAHRPKPSTSGTGRAPASPLRASLLQTEAAQERNTPLTAHTSNHTFGDSSVRSMHGNGHDVASKPPTVAAGGSTRINDIDYTKLQPDQIEWKSQAQRQRGELVLTKMRFQVDSLQRQLDSIKQEKSLVAKRYEHQLGEVQRRYENELLLQREALKNEASLKEMLVSNERVKHQRDYALELKRVENDIVFEADRIRQSGIDAQAVEAELLSLRQLRHVFEQRLQALEENNATMASCLEEAQRMVQNEKEKTMQLQLFYSQQDETLLQKIGEEKLASHANLTKLERKLANEVIKLRSEKSELARKQEREMEEAKYEIVELRTQNAALAANKSDGQDIGGLEKELFAQQDIERLKIDLDKVKAANRFLRERAVVFDKHSRTLLEMSKDGDSKDQTLGTEHSMSRTKQEEDEQGKHHYWLPSPNVGENVDCEYRNGQVLILLNHLSSADDRLYAELAQLFWQLVMEESVLQRRIVRSRDVIINLQEQLRNVTETMLLESQKHTQDLATKMDEMRAESRQTQFKDASEKASLAIQVEFQDSAIRELEVEVARAGEALNEQRRQTMRSDQERFSLLMRRWKEGRAECVRYELREKLWNRLTDRLQQMIRVIMEPEASHNEEQHIQRRKEKETLELECTSCISKLNELARQSADVAGRVNDEFSSFEGQLEEVTAVLRSQLKDAQEEGERTSHALREVREEMREISRESRLVRLALDQETSKTRQLEKESHTAMEEAIKLRQLLQSKVMMEDEETASLQAQVQKLQDELAEYKMIAQSRTAVSLQVAQSAARESQLDAEATGRSSEHGGLGEVISNQLHAIINEKTATCTPRPEFPERSEGTTVREQSPNYLGARVPNFPSIANVIPMYKT